MTLREEVESMLGYEPSKPAKIRQSYPRIVGQTPSDGRKKLKAWARVALYVVLVGFTAGYLSVFFTH